jgi:hypothetical protein
VEDAVKHATPEDQALCDFGYFASRYPMNLGLWECQMMMADIIQTFLEGETNPATGEEYETLVILGPPDHGKTSRISVPLVLWYLARDVRRKVMLVSGKDDYAEQIAAAAMRRIERDPVFHEKFGLRPAGVKWADNQYVLDRPNWQDKDASLLPVGTNSTIVSQRANLILGDDMLTPDNSASPKDRARTWQWADTDLDSRLERPGGKKILLGHKVHKEDYYGLLKRRPEVKVVELQAIISDRDQRVLAPEKWTYKQLCRLRDNNPTGFNLFYQQKAQDDGIYITRKACDAIIDRSRPMYVSGIPDEVRVKYDKLVMGIDPAFSDNRWSKNTVISLWGYRLELDQVAGSSEPPQQRTRRDLLYMFRGRTLPDVLLQVCDAKIRMFKPDRVCVEANVGQVLLLPHFKREFPEWANRFVPVYTESKKGSLEREVAQLMELINKGPRYVTVPYEGTEAQAVVEAFFEELTGYPTFMFTDTIMSFYLAEKGAGGLFYGEVRGEVDRFGVMGGVSRELWRPR